MVCDSETDFVCNDGLACVDLRRRCDGYPDCSDSSDEDETMCPESECFVKWKSLSSKFEFVLQSKFLLQYLAMLIGNFIA